MRYKIFLLPGNFTGLTIDGIKNFNFSLCAIACNYMCSSYNIVRHSVIKMVEIMMMTI